MADTRTLVPRSKKVLFYGVPAASGDTTTYHRMKGFTDVSTSKNAKEYTRQYVDELFEQTDVTGYSPSTSYGFDQYAGDPVHADIVKITDDELIGSNAVRILLNQIRQSNDPEAGEYVPESKVLPCRMEFRDQ